MDSEIHNGGIFTWWYIIGDKGATQFMLLSLKDCNTYLPMDLGVHHKHPVFEDQEPNHCKIFSPCYFLPSFKGATDLYERYKESQDPEQIWLELELLYESIFPD